MPPAQTKEVIESQLNAKLEQVFEWINLEKPLGSASISQVIPSLMPPAWGICQDLGAMQLGWLRGGLGITMLEADDRQCSCHYT